ncbi:alpha/beta hydrolase [Streptomyces sp. R302]|uniref:alpha/beta fold hydrolase n=1 Tax=unclassified Streptomyces TaxID=2593676 RepID=UPI00145CFBD4|nr:MULTISPECIES: alpha/beta hydrolase [unclassified Streptomyces]NML50504.1 alpha/beta hydrolase [Streptomyces sp. R301]NML79495.1 alpha/beta hydrolase [Streptomyces sp. R302]
MTLSHDVAGSGPRTVVLLHSGVCDRRMWDGQFQALADAGHRVVRCDLRGFGDTPVDAPHLHADDVRDLLDALGVDRAVLVGSSFGGEVALDIAVRHPGRTEALALLCAGAPVEHEAGPELRAFFTREEALLEAGDVDAATALNVDLWCGPEAGPEARALVHAMQRRAFELQLPVPEELDARPSGVTEGDLRGVTVPALVATGAHDVPDFGVIGDRLAALLPAARRVELDWAGHLPALERPEETLALLTDYLSGLSAPAAAAP